MTLRHPAGNGTLHALTPADAGWSYVGFEAHRLASGATAQGCQPGREIILVMVEGRAIVSADGQSFGEIGNRLSVFEKSAPHCLYLPPGAAWQVTATTDAEIAICSAPSSGNRPAALIDPAAIQLTERGTGTNLRHINNIAMEAQDIADSLLVTEVFTPPGHWSSYPPHRHDEDRFPDMTYLEETYYHRIDPPQGFAIQRVFTDDLTLDETIAVADRDLVLVPRGHHPCAAPHGIGLYYLNVMAGPLRKWRFAAHPDFGFLE